MKLSKKRVGLFGSILTAVLVVSVIVLFMQSSGIVPMSKIIAYAAGVPDSFGNRIYSVSVLQNTTGSWSSVASVSYTTFVNGTTLTFPSNQYTDIMVVTYVNKTLASSIPLAMSRTRVYITISGVVTSASMYVITATDAGSFYMVYFGYPDTEWGHHGIWLPATDTTYTITVQYQAYY